MHVLNFLQNFFLSWQKTFDDINFNFKYEILELSIFRRQYLFVVPVRKEFMRKLNPFPASYCSSFLPSSMIEISINTINICTHITTFSQPSSDWFLFQILILIHCYSSKMNNKVITSLLTTIDNSNLNDITINLQDGNITASKIVLSSTSDYFKAMFIYWPSLFNFLV